MRGSAFLVKALTIAGAGGGPLILQAHSFSSTTEEQPRRFKWSLSLNLNGQGGSGGEAVKKEVEVGKGYWITGLEDKTWQGVAQNKWEELSGTAGRSVYKLVFRSSWTQEVDKNLGEKSAKGALALIKASWGGDGVSYKKLKVEEIKVGEDRKVWLIIAKGQESIYLIPVVRSSNGRVFGIGSEEDKKIDTEGVKDIKGWTEKFDKDEEWDQKHNECLAKEYKTGFNITRASSFVSSGGGKIKELKREGGLEIFYYDGDSKQSIDWGEFDQKKKEGEKMNLNAGKMIRNGLRGGCGRDRRLNKRYFPLDIFVFGSSKKLIDKTSSSRNLTQIIEIKDTITQVIGVRLDQVVISDTGIGAGKKNEIKWGSITKPTLVRELLK